MNKITVKRIKLCDLSKQMIFELNMLYKTELGNFIVLYNNRSETLFVNEKIREDDVKAFADIVEYQGRYINDPNCELSETIDHVFKKYGIDTTRILLDAYSDRKKERENESAKKCAKKYTGSYAVFNQMTIYQIISTEKKSLFTMLENLQVKMEYEQRRTWLVAVRNTVSLSAIS